MIVKHAILGTLVTAVTVSVPLQICILPSTVNMATALIACVASLGALLYTFLSKAIDDQPLSTFAILGFAVTTLMGALLVQTLSWVPLSASLYDPIGTFATLSGYLTIAIVTHALYRYFSAPTHAKEGTIRQLLSGAGIYATPTPGALWVMGFLGLFGWIIFSRFDNFIGKIGIALSFFAWGPFLIPLYLRELGDSYCNARRHGVAIIAFGLLIAFLGLLLNFRVVMFTGAATVGLLYLMAGMRSDKPITPKGLAWVGVALALTVIISGPLANLATAMVIARQWRGKMTGIEMVSTTFRIYNQPSLIDAYRAERAAVARYSAYDEHYIDNPLLARFVNTKYDDNALHFAGAIKTEAAKEQLRHETIKFLWSTLPAPVLSVLGVNVDKDSLGYSMTDYIAYISRGLPLGTHRLGSLFAQGQAVLGPLFPFVYALICLAMYVAMDLLTIRRVGSRATLSALGMLLTWSFFIQGLTQEALHVVVVFLFRNYLQMLLIYFVVLTGVRICASALAPLSMPGPQLPQRTQ